MNTVDLNLYRIVYNYYAKSGVLRKTLAAKNPNFQKNKDWWSSLNLILGEEH